MGVKHAPGTFCWAELVTSDPTAAKAFYRRLFDWTTHDDPLPTGGVYTMIQKDGGNVGGLYALMPQMKAQGVPPHWMQYVSVDDADAAAAKCTELGGTVVMPSLDVMEIGRMAVMQSPDGATFAVWQPKSHAGKEHAEPQPGTMVWNELISKDPDRAGSFYSQLFGWDSSSQDMGDFQYTVFTQDGENKAGMMSMPAEMGPAPSNWMVYFGTADCDATVKTATDAGAQVLAPPMDVPEVGRFAALMDPQGAVFSVIKFAEV